MTLKKRKKLQAGESVDGYTKDIELGYWRKHADLHGLMENIFEQKVQEGYCPSDFYGKDYESPYEDEQPGDTWDSCFNCIPLLLEKQEIEELLKTSYMVLNELLMNQEAVDILGLQLEDANIVKQEDATWFECIFNLDKVQERMYAISYAQEERLCEIYERNSTVGKTQGFFFGNSTPGKWLNTIKIFNEVLKETNFETEEVFYNSWW